MAAAKLREAFGRKEWVQLWSIKVGGLVGPEFCAEEPSLIILIKTGPGRAFTPLQQAWLYLCREERSSSILGAPPDWTGSKGFT